MTAMAGYCDSFRGMVLWGACSLIELGPEAHGAGQFEVLVMSSGVPRSACQIVPYASKCRMPDDWFGPENG